MSGGGRVGIDCPGCGGRFVTPQTGGKLCEECEEQEDRLDSEMAGDDMARLGVAVRAPWHQQDHHRLVPPPEG